MGDGNDSQEGENDQTAPTGDALTSANVDYAQNEDDSSFGEDKPLIPP